MTAEELITCPVTGWYLRRIYLMAALFAGLALYFLYDGAIGYPRQNFHADLFDAFETGKNGGRGAVPAGSAQADTAVRPPITRADTAVRPPTGAGTNEKDREEMAAAQHAGASGGSWAEFAAARHLGEKKPKRHSAGAIRQQFAMAGILGMLAIGALGVAMAQRKRNLRAGPDWLETSSGRRIGFAAITGADFSKWDRGIALLKTGGGGDDENGGGCAVKIDDYRFAGAAKILERIRRARPDLEPETWAGWEPPTADRPPSIESEKSDGN